MLSDRTYGCKDRNIVVIAKAERAYEAINKIEPVMRSVGYSMFNEFHDCADINTLHILTSKTPNWFIRKNCTGELARVIAMYSRLGNMYAVEREHAKLEITLWFENGGKGRTPQEVINLYYTRYINNTDYGPTLSDDLWKEAINEYFGMTVTDCYRIFYVE